MIATTHRVIQLAQLEDKLTSMARQNRIWSGTAASIGNRNAAMYFVDRARKADVLLQYRVLPRLRLANGGIQ